MAVLPLAQQHLDHYLTGGGKDLRIDLEEVIRQDSGVRAKLAKAIQKFRRSSIKINQQDYAVKDFQFAFGAIDQLDFEVDRATGLVHVWCMDRYEWHPVGFGYKLLKGDVRRVSNCVHAAAVELKPKGAADYWMKGDAVVPLKLITAPAAPPSSGGGSIL